MRQMISIEFDRTYHFSLIIQKSEQSEHDSEHVSEHIKVNNINPVNRVNT